MNTAEEIIRHEIAAAGPISFARFMELALYAPGAGYYAAACRPIGRRGDFYTSVSVGPAFGFLLAAQFAAWARERQGGRFLLVEAGAHDGQLMSDVLEAVERFHPGVWARIEARVLEPSAAREAVQRPRLARWAGRVQWWKAWEEAGAPVEGVIFANELLDAFPVHRLGWDAARRVWFEWGVTLEAGRLGWCRLEPAPERIPAGLGPLEAWLPDGFVVEACPAAEAWWREAAGVLGGGRLVTFDYGFEEEEGVSAARARGTARAYFQHRVSDDLLAHPGAQDLTAHVDFARLVRGGEAAGLRTEAFLPQGRWLGAGAARLLGEEGPTAEWLMAHARQLQTLTHPSHLGHALRVLVQARGP